jgi:hypothetical protein
MSFSTSNFFMHQFSRGPCRDIHYIARVNDTGDKLFTGVNDTGYKLSPMSV